MKKQDFVLLSAIILVGVLIITLTVSFFKKYEMPQWEHRNDRELNGISEEQTEMVLPPSELSIEEKMVRALSGLYIVDGDEMMCAGYRIKVGNPLITPRAGSWILDDCAKEDLIEEMDSEQNILSKETYISFGFNICCEEEFYPYITTGEQNELYLNNATLWLGSVFAVMKFMEWVRISMLEVITSQCIKGNYPLENVSKQSWCL